MSEIGIVINLDTRAGYLSDAEKHSAGGKNGTGVVSADYFIDGVKNKVDFFRGYDTEVTVYIDLHEMLTGDLLVRMNDLIRQGVIDNLYINRHNESFGDMEYYPKWLCLSILNPIICTRSKYIVHFDCDTMAFRRDDCTIIDDIKGWLDSGKYDFVSYPSRWSPHADCDSGWDYNWASTRFFFGRRDFFDYEEIKKCLESSEYLYKKYGDKYRRCPWLEHVLGIMTGSKDKVYYLPHNFNLYTIFCWIGYKKGLIKQLNDMSFDNVIKYVAHCGGIGYPCDVRPK